MTSDQRNSQKVLKLKGKEANTFKQHVYSELSPLEKQELENAFEFYKQKSPKE